MLLETISNSLAMDSEPVETSVFLVSMVGLDDQFDVIVTLWIIRLNIEGLQWGIIVRVLIVTKDVSFLIKFILQTTNLEQLWC